VVYNLRKFPSYHQLYREVSAGSKDVNSSEWTPSIIHFLVEGIISMT
jgi:hypothetical protein